jgi:preprotein translocase SecE subunit
VARNRRRAAERKGRRRPEDANGGSEERLHRTEQPGSLDHASGEVDEVEARIVAGAGADPDPLEDGESFDQAALEEAALGADDGPPARGGRPSAPAAAEDRPAAGRGGPRFLNFLRASWAELQRVQWPDRRQVGQATAVVLGFVIVAGAFLGVIDALAKQVVDLIL